MILALLLAFAPLPDPATNYPAYERYTHGEFRCDDRPYTPGCGNDAPPCSDRDYLALRCGGAGDAYEKDVCSEVGSRRAMTRCVVAHRLAEVRRERERYRVCGPEGANDDDGVNITCDREGWDPRHHRYLSFCGTRWTRHILADPEHRPLPNDPWVRWYVTHGFSDGVSLEDARIARADNVVNGCDE